MEEAIEFAKKHLGIQKFELGDDVEMANWVNEGLVNISNRFKGKAQMPKQVLWDKSTFIKHPDWAAYHNAKDNILGINKTYYDGIKGKLKTAFETIEQHTKSMNDKGKISSLSLIGRLAQREVSSSGAFKMLPCIDKDLQVKFMSYLHAYRTNPEGFSRFQADTLSDLLGDMKAATDKLFNETLDGIANLLKDDKIMQALSSKNIKVKSLEEYSKLTKKEQIATYADLLLQADSHSVTGTVRGNSKFGTIYHEMGHLLHEMNSSLKDRMCGRLSGKSEKAFLADAEKLKTAGKISWYAKTNPDEFVAETFSALCAGRKLPDDVMELYKYYKGPIIPNM